MDCSPVTNFGVLEFNITEVYTVMLFHAISVTYAEAEIFFNTLKIIKNYLIAIENKAVSYFELLIPLQMSKIERDCEYKFFI